MVTSGKGGELLSEGEVLQNQGRPGPQHSVQRPDQQKEQKPNHRPTLARREISNDFELERLFADYADEGVAVLGPRNTGRAGSRYLQRLAQEARSRVGNMS